MTSKGSLELKAVTWRRAKRCYELAGVAMIDDIFGPEARLVQGVLTRIPTSDTAASFSAHGHAWIERGDEAWDPLHDQWFPIPLFNEIFEPLEETRWTYDREAAAKALLLQRHFGPWEEEARDRAIEESWARYHARH